MKLLIELAAGQYLVASGLAGGVQASLIDVRSVGDDAGQGVPAAKVLNQSLELLDGYMSQIHQDQPQRIVRLQPGDPAGGDRHECKTRSLRCAADPRSEHQIGRNEQHVHGSDEWEGVEGV
jgi:hypothetical protein